MTLLLRLGTRGELSVVSLILCGLALACSGDRGATGSSCSVKNEGDAGTVITCTDGTKAVVANAMSGSSACSVKDNGDGTKTIKCSDGTSVSVSNGKNGQNGTNGQDGTNGAMGEHGTDGVNGTNGVDGMNGNNGLDGSNGSNGNNGVDGGPGRSAYVVGPGLDMEITAVTIPADLHPLASIRIRDTAGHPLDRTGTYTPDAVSASFVLSYLSSSGGVVGQYVPYNTGTVTGQTVNSVAPVLASATQPKSESNGTWTEVDPSQGTYTYRFANALPSDYDQTKTHTLAVYASRTTNGALYASDPIFNFRPDGQAVTETRAIVTTQACNQCHDPIAEHGGSRRELGLCITCHVAGMADPESGNSIDLREMIHKIHRGATLPTTTPFKIVGFQNAVHDYSDVVFPQATENCTACHQGGADSDRWKTSFSRTACGSCHDNISFTNPPPSGMTLHTGGQQTTDTLCVNCHGEGMGPVATYVTDVTKVHVTQEKFDLRSTTDGSFISAAPTITGQILSVTQNGSSQPVVTFEIDVNGTPYDILAGGNALDRLRFTFAGPTTDYVNATQYTAQASSGTTGTLAAAGSPGQFTWTSASTMTQISTSVTPNIPLTGTWAVGMEGRLSRPASKPSNARVTVLYFMHNDVFYFPITDSSAVPRRTAVVVANCNHCHDNLQAHGGSRNDPEYCVLCHNANKDATDIPAPATGTTKLTSSLRLSHFVHRIHTGVNGANPFQIGSNDFSDVLFPGDRRDCTHCHVPDHYKLPLPPLLPSHMTQIDSSNARVASTDTYMGPTAAACTGCHDDDQTAVHVATQALVSGTDPSKIQEACATCHAFGQAYGLDIVHARPGL